jgi:hypothetical protein
LFVGFSIQIVVSGCQNKPRQLETKPLPAVAAASPERAPCIPVTVFLHQELSGCRDGVDDDDGFVPCCRKPACSLLVTLSCLVPTIFISQYDGSTSTRSFLFGSGLHAHKSPCHHGNPHSRLLPCPPPPPLRSCYPHHLLALKLLGSLS